MPDASELTRPLKILLVDDEVLSALALRESLLHHGFSLCRLAATGEEAIAEAERERPDVVLMDILLAGPMNGIEAARRIVDRHPVAILFMTGYSLPEIKEAADAVKPIAYLAKPILGEEVTAQIRAWVQSCPACLHNR